MNRKLVFAASISLGVVLLAAVYSLLKGEKVLYELSKFSLPRLVVFLSFSVLVYLFLSMRWRSVIIALKGKISLPSALKYELISFAAGYFLPTGRLSGGPAKFLLLRKQGMSFTKGFSTFMIDWFVEMTTNLGFLTIVVIFIVPASIIATSIKIMFCLVGVAVIGSVLLVARRVRNSKPILSHHHVAQIDKHRIIRKIIRQLRAVRRANGQFLRNAKSVILTYCLAACTWLTSAFEVFFALRVIGIDASVLMVVVILVSLMVTYLIAVPASVGVLEFGQASIFQFLQLSPEAGIAFTIVLRIRDILMTLLGLALLSSEGFSILNFRGQDG